MVWLCEIKCLAMYIYYGKVDKMCGSKYYGNEITSNLHKVIHIRSSSHVDLVHLVYFLEILSDNTII